MQPEGRFSTVFDPYPELLESDAHLWSLFPYNILVIILQPEPRPPTLYHLLTHYFL
jgi:hypothetical protein